MTLINMCKNAAVGGLLIFTSTSWAGHRGGDHEHDEAAKAATTIVDVAAGNEDCSTLVAALQAADLVDVLACDGP